MCILGEKYERTFGRNRFETGRRQNDWKENDDVTSHCKRAMTSHHIETVRRQNDLKLELQPSAYRSDHGLLNIGRTSKLLLQSCEYTPEYVSSSSCSAYLSSDNFHLL